MNDFERYIAKTGPIAGNANLIVSDKSVRIGSERRELQRWLLEQRRSSGYNALEQLAEMLTPMFQFLADGYATGNLEHRAWVLLYAIRPDLLGGETMKQYAESRGVAHFAVQDVLNKFKRELPHLVVDTSLRAFGNGKSEARRWTQTLAAQAREEKARHRIADLRQRGLNAKKCAQTKALKKAAAAAERAA